MSDDSTECPFAIGDWVRFSPSARTLALYQDVEAFGVKIGEAVQITEIRDGCYLYFASGGGQRTGSGSLLSIDRREKRT